MTMHRFFFTILILSLGSFCFAQQQSKEELQRKTQALLREIENVKAELAEAQKNKIQSLGVVKNIEKKIDIRNQIIRNIKGEVFYVEKDIIRTYRDIDTLKKELSAIKAQYAESVVYAYKNRSNYDFLNFLFSANNFADAMRRISYLKTYRNFRTKKANDIARVQNQLESKVASLKGKREEKQTALNLEGKQMKELESERKEKDAIVSQFAGQESKLRKSLQNREKERRQIQNAIAAIIKREKEEALRREREEAKRKESEARAAAKNNTTGVATTSTAKSTTNTNTSKRSASSVLENTPEGLIISQKFEENRGTLPWPIDKMVVTLHYGTNMVDKIAIPSDGITMETSIGAPVKAVFNGDVSSVYNVGNIQVVTIKHGKYFTTYSNLSSASVSRGQKVSAGQVIGRAAVNDYGVGEVSFQVDTEKGTLNPEVWLRRQ